MTFKAQVILPNCISDSRPALPQRFTHILLQPSASMALAVVESGIPRALNSLNKDYHIIAVPGSGRPKM